jgi:hypothetical protein
MDRGLRWGGHMTALFGQLPGAEDREVAGVTFPSARRAEDREESVGEAADAKQWVCVYLNRELW